jgi:beta-lactam-binding protein with PASTA domain
LIGLDVAEARRLLTAAGYLIREIEDDNAAAKGTVIEQQPAAGTEYAQNQTVIIAVSKGP